MHDADGFLAQLKYINEQVANTSEEVFSKNAAFLKR